MNGFRSQEIKMKFSKNFLIYLLKKSKFFQKNNILKIQLNQKYDNSLFF